MILNCRYYLNYTVCKQIINYKNIAFHRVVSRSKGLADVRLYFYETRKVEIFDKKLLQKFWSPDFLRKFIRSESGHDMPDVSGNPTKIRLL